MRGDTASHPHCDVSFDVRADRAEEGSGMSAGVRVSRAEAVGIAVRVMAALRPGCDRIEVAGSLRREMRDVGDIEIVAQPKTHKEPSGLFFEVDAEVSDLDPLVDRLVKSGEYERLLGKDRYTKLRHRASGLQVDLFTVRPPAQWGVIHTIRTGPAAYSQWLVTEARRRGFHVREGALHRGSLGCGSVPCEVIETPEERDLFEALGMRWPQPVERGRM
jgi:DNA polymerase/3'-5' exonuclease PolX